METTVSILDSALEHIPVVRTRKVQDMAEAAVYAAADSNGRKNMSAVWESHIENVENRKKANDKPATIIVNGMAVNSKGLRYWLQVEAGWGKKISG